MERLTGRGLVCGKADRGRQVCGKADMEDECVERLIGRGEGLACGKADRRDLCVERLTGGRLVCGKADRGKTSVWKG